MADWLVAQSILIGKPRAEVDAMLGPVADTAKFREYDLVYRLGMERGFFSIDSEWLALKVNVSGVVTSAEIVRD
jgi:hypothetical protein